MATQYTSRQRTTIKGTTVNHIAFDIKRALITWLANQRTSLAKQYDRWQNTPLLFIATEPDWTPVHC